MLKCNRERKGWKIRYEHKPGERRGVDVLYVDVTDDPEVAVRRKSPGCVLLMAADGKCCANNRLMMVVAEHSTCILAARGGGGRGRVVLGVVVTY